MNFFFYFTKYDLPSCEGLFLYDESTHQHWINPSSLENDSEYQLIGLLLGLAIYNNIILDIRFPLVIYRKLLGCPVDFTDLYTSHPVMPLPPQGDSRDDAPPTHLRVILLPPRDNAPLS